MEGNGSVQFGQGARSGANLLSRRFKKIDLYTGIGFSDELNFTVRPNSYLDVLPFELESGEYRYTMLRSSVGQRLEMWSAAIRLFTKAPLLGVGTGAYQSEAKTMVDAGVAPPGSADYDHPHSDYFDALANRGLLGFLTLAALLGVPAWFFSRHLGSREPIRVGAALGGLLIVTGFALCGLTETMFIHSLTIGWYVIMTSVFLVLVGAPTKRENGTL